MFPSYEEIGEILDDLAQELPPVFFEGLNLGIVLVEEVKYHSEARDQDLIIMGEYVRNRLGRQIKIYYGSFKRLYSYLSKEELEEKLRHTLRHEFTHHIESLAGDRSLEIEDEEKLALWRERRKDEY